MRIEPKAISIGLTSLVVLSVPFEVPPINQSPIFEIMGETFSFFMLFLSGAVTGYFARHNELVNGIVCGVAASFLMGLLSYVRELLGLPGDAIGFVGTLFVSLLILPFSIGLSSIGAVCVRVWKRNRATP